MLLLSIAGFIHAASAKKRAAAEMIKPETETPRELVGV